MATHSADIDIKNGCLIKVDEDFLKKNDGCFDVPCSVKKVNPFLLSSQNNLKSLKFNKSTTHIGSFAFSGCINLKSISMYDLIEDVGYRAFYGCHKDLEITIIVSGASKKNAEKLQENLKNSYPGITVKLDLTYAIQGKPSTTFFNQSNKPEDDAFSPSPSQSTS